jgi:hypothetical protein
MNPGKILIGLGAALVFLGIVFIGGEKLGIRLGRLPGDIAIEGKNGGFYFPIVTCIVLSVLLTLVSWLFFKRF